MGLLVAGLIAVPMVMFVGEPIRYFLFTYGCREEEDRLAEALAGDPVLDAPPTGAGKAETYKGCDDDDLFVWVGTEFPYDASRQSVLVHYRETARANGWQPQATDADGRPSDCFTKRIGGTTAYLSVYGPDNGKAGVGITADQAGSEWC
ncbi:hypothetical protein GA0115259_104884 [Streptomyces sp. MnatMP-M17]|nr:hypothetical protein GA0115259_104884 [Streptomyces sp. MnatMP-M17]